MPVFHGPVTKPTRYLFVDGASFKKSIENFQKKYNLNFNIYPRQLFSRYDKVFYYDALPPSDSPNYHEKKIALDRISEIPFCHVRTGNTRLGRSKSLNQKGVDVLLALDAMEHAYKSNCEELHIITNDLDFMPLIETLVRLGKVAHLTYEPGRTNKALIQSADNTTPMNFSFYKSHYHGQSENLKNSGYGGINPSEEESFLSNHDTETVKKENGTFKRFTNKKHEYYSLLLGKGHYCHSTDPELLIFLEDHILENTYPRETPDVSAL